MAMTDPIQALVSLQAEIRKGMPTHPTEKSLHSPARPVAGLGSTRGRISRLSVEGMKWDCL